VGPLDRLDAAPALIARFLLCSLVAGCAVDCTDSDWKERGYRDGRGGHPPQDLRIARHCPGFSDAAYLDGWRDGYDEYDRRKADID